MIISDKSEDSWKCLQKASIWSDFWRKSLNFVPENSYFGIPESSKLHPKPPDSSPRSPPGSMLEPPGSIWEPPGSILEPPGSILEPPGPILEPPGSISEPPDPDFIQSPDKKVQNVRIPKKAVILPCFYYIFGHSEVVSAPTLIFCNHQTQKCKT